jgi:hypothetical protein
MIKLTKRRFQCSRDLKCDAFRVPVVRVEISGLGVGSVTLLLRMLIRSCRHHGIIVAAACVVSVESAARQLLGCIRFLCCPTAATGKWVVPFSVHHAHLIKSTHQWPFSFEFRWLDTLISGHRPETEL